MVLDQGRIIEFDKPRTLLADSSTRFYELCRAAGKGEFAKKFQAAKKPLIIVGSAVSEHADGPAMYNALSKFVEKNKDKLVTPEWNGFSVLQRVSSSRHRT